MDVSLEDWDLTFEKNDDRPAFVFDATRKCQLRATAERGRKSDYDVGLRNKAGVATDLKTWDEGMLDTPAHVHVPKGSGLALPPYTLDAIAQSHLKAAAMAKPEAKEPP